MRGQAIVRQWLMTGGLMAAMTSASVSLVHAQSGNDTKWGVRATVAPSWEVPSSLLEIDLLADFLGADSTIRGSQIELGVLRGSRFGGDWGLSYFRKRFSDATRIAIDNGSSCFDNGATSQCFDDTTVYTTSSVAVHGLELHKFVPWFTIKQRAQIGMNLGVGAMTVAGGTVTKTATTTDVTFDPRTFRPSVSQGTTTEILDGKAFLEDLGVPAILPLAKIELAVTGIVTDNFKVRASGGVNLPGVQRLAVTAIYLFGR
jgi:hypothetical protein